MHSRGRQNEMLGPGRVAAITMSKDNSLWADLQTIETRSYLTQLKLVAPRSSLFTSKLEQEDVT